MSRITHFEIPSDNPEQSMEFYKKAFGWSYHQFGGEPYWLAITGDTAKPGINGAIMKKKHPQQPMTNSILVESIDRAVEDITQAGGTIVFPKSPIPGVGWLAYFMDPDKNILGIMQNDTSAK